MSDYNKLDLFLEPKTTQHGSHMIMSNVHKPTKMKYVNIDTKFRDEYNYLQTSNYNITLPERINDVKTMRLTNIEIPMTFYNISANLGNNYFKIRNQSKNDSTMVIINDGNYTKSSLKDEIIRVIGLLPSNDNHYRILDYDQRDAGLKSTFKTIPIRNINTDIIGDYILHIEFDVDITGQPDKYNFKSKLGWLLGFRNFTYEITPTSIVSDCFIDLMGPRYLYLAIEEFNKGNQNSFVSPLSTSLVNKNVIARITMNNAVYPFGQILPANQYNALLISDKRNYTGKIDLQKMNVQLLNESGVQISLNGMDFSFCLEVEHE